MKPELDINKPFRDLPQKQDCFLQPAPLEPSAINSSSINIIEFEIKSGFPYSIMLTMTWDKPAKTYGTIRNYQLRIVRQSVKSGDNVTTAMIVTITSEDMVCHHQNYSRHLCDLFHNLLLASPAWGTA